MNELQRAEYLSVLGVASYVPRYLLPLAPEPRQAVLPQDLEPDMGAPRGKAPLVQLEPKAAKSASPAAKLADLGVLDSAAESKAQSPQPEKAAEVLLPDTAAAAQPAPGPFVLSCWWLGEELLAVDSREPGAALPVEALFNNITRALGWDRLPREQDRLRWPLAENRFGPAASASEARDTCSIWLEAASLRRPVKSIWLMGQQAQDFCSPVALEAQVNDWNGIRVIAMPSLSELLQQPEQKRDLWHLLQQVYPEQTRVQ